MSDLLLSFLIVLCIIYVGNILKSAITLMQLKTCLKKLECFIQAYKNPGPYSATLPAECQSAYQDLLKYNPVISKYTTSSLSYNRGEFENHQTSIFLCGKLLMVHNEKKHDLFNAFNPINAFKIFLQLPVTILSWMGFRIKDKARGWIDAVGWLITILFDYFGEEIKGWIISFF